MCLLTPSCSQSKYILTYISLRSSIGNQYEPRFIEFTPTSGSYPTLGPLQIKVRRKRTLLNQTFPFAETTDMFKVTFCCNLQFSNATGWMTNNRLMHILCIFISQRADHCNTQRSRLTQGTRWPETEQTANKNRSLACTPKDSGWLIIKLSIFDRNTAAVIIRTTLVGELCGTIFSWRGRGRCPTCREAWLYKTVGELV